MIRVANLYAGIGGNRRLWHGDIKVTAVEKNEAIAHVYRDYFPGDKIIIGDAHDFLLKNYDQFDFIWSSPPCPTHSRARFWANRKDRYQPAYPDIRLYEEILFLKHYYKGKWVVENVVPYYEPLIPARKIGRHLFWSNFYIPEYKVKDVDVNRATIREMERYHKVDLSSYKGLGRRDRILRNCVNSQTGLLVFESALNTLKKELITEQKTLF